MPHINIINAIVCEWMFVYIFYFSTLKRPTDLDQILFEVRLPQVIYLEKNIIQIKILYNYRVKPRGKATKFLQIKTGDLIVQILKMFLKILIRILL